MNARQIAVESLEGIANRPGGLEDSVVVVHMRRFPFTGAVEQKMCCVLWWLQFVPQTFN